MTFLTLNNLHFDIEIIGNHFKFKASDSPKNTKAILKKISFILSKKLQCSKEESDFYPALEKESMETCLQKLASRLYKNLNNENSNQSEITSLFNKVFPKQKLHLKQRVFFEIEEKISIEEQSQLPYLKEKPSFIEKLQLNALLELFENPKLYELEHRPLLEKGFLRLINQIKKEDLNEENKKKLNPLFLLAIQHDLPIGAAEFWLKQGADIHAKDKKGKNALDYAMINNSKRTAKYLIQKKFNLETTDKEGLTVLMHAVKKNDLEWCQFFIEKGANLYTENEQRRTAWNYLFEVNIYEQFKNRPTTVGSTEIPQWFHKTSQWVKEIEGVSYKICNLFLKNHIEFDEKERKEKSDITYSLLKKAISHGYSESVTDLLKHVKISSENYDNLLRNILRPIFGTFFTSTSDSRTIGNRKPSRESSRKNWLKEFYPERNEIETRVHKMLQIIRKKEPKLIKNGMCTGRNAIFRAIEVDSSFLLEECLEAGIDVDIRDDNRLTPLMYAANKWNFRLCKLLLEEGAEPDLQCNQGDTPLHYAIRMGDIEIVKILLEYGANPYLQNATPPYLQSTSLSNAFDFADEFGCLEILKILQEWEKQKKEQRKD